MHACKVINIIKIFDFIINYYSIMQLALLYIRNCNVFSFLFLLKFLETELFICKIISINMKLATQNPFQLGYNSSQNRCSWKKEYVGTKIKVKLMHVYKTFILVLISSIRHLYFANFHSSTVSYSIPSTTLEIIQQIFKNYQSINS